jgi:acyl-CoA thioesterase FadM
VQHKISLNGELCAEGTEKRVWVVRDGGRIKSQPIPDSVRAKFN